MWKDCPAEIERMMQCNKSLYFVKWPYEIFGYYWFYIFEEEFLGCSFPDGLENTCGVQGEING
jgi:hypothetical protein